MGGLGPDLAVGRQQLHVCIDLDRAPPRDDLVRAARATVETFPVLGCRYVPGWWRDRWVAAPDPAAEDVVEVIETDDVERGTAALVDQQLDPAHGWPWRISLLGAPDATRLVVTVLHMAADAAGTLAVVREFGSQLCTDRRAADQGPTDRGTLQLVRALRVGDLPRLAVEVVREWVRPLLYPWIAHTAADTVDRGAPAVFRSAVADLPALRRRCRDLDCTINDALVTALALVNASQAQRGLVGTFFTVDLRRYLRDDRPRIANLSGFDTLLLPRARLTDFATAAAAISRRTAARKRGLPGLPAMLAMSGLTAAAPHGLQRLIAPLGTGLFRSLATRGLLVTNIGPLDPYLAPWGDQVKSASVVGPFLRGLRTPIVTATSFRERLTLHVEGFDAERVQTMAVALQDLLTSP